MAEYDIGYLYNGTLLAAAIAEDFKIRRCDEKSSDAYINISNAVLGRYA